MKVSQLIQLLSDYPADTKVLVEGYENGYDPTHCPCNSSPSSEFG